MVSATPISSPAPGRKLIAPVWYTVLLVSIFLGVTLAGALFQRPAQSTPGVLKQHPNVVPLYLSVIAVEWFLVYGVWAGIRIRGVHLRDLIGGRWKSAKDVLIDLALAIVVWILRKVDIQLKRIAAVVQSDGRSSSHTTFPGRLEVVSRLGGMGTSGSYGRCVQPDDSRCEP